MTAESLRTLVPSLSPRRLVTLGVFLGLVIVFRHLLVLLVFFVAFQRPLTLASEWLAPRLKAKRALVVLALVALFLAALGTALALGLGRGIQAGLAAREALPERIAAFKETPLFLRLQGYVGESGRLVETARNFADRAVEYLQAAGRLLLHAVLGFILAVIYLLEEEEVDGFVGRLERRTLGATLLRWLGYLADAVSVTLQFQIIVALVNAVLTFPVMLLVGIPHATTFLFMVFLSGMIPVVGNFVAGAVLTLLAFQASGWFGVITFTALTVVLHKVESYYLNPRLASRHVRLPAFVLVVSLLLWEHLLGFVGLFVSFPFLYVATKIGEEFQEEDGADHNLVAVSKMA